jgi:hypothetical protein
VRLRWLLVFVFVLPVLAGCSGADAGRAQQLLQQAQDAQLAVSSESFSAHLKVETQGQTVDLLCNGGGYLRGKRAGDLVMNVKVSAPVAVPFQTLRVAKIGNSTSVEVDGRRTDLPASAGGAAQSSPLAAFDITRYVKDVKVEGGQVLDGRPVTKIVGILDTASLIAGMAKLSNVPGASGLPNLNGTVGDTRVVIYVDDATHLLVAALADLSLGGDAGDPKLHLDLAITGTNRPVAGLSAS